MAKFVRTVCAPLAEFPTDALELADELVKDETLINKHGIVRMSVKRSQSEIA